MDRDINASLNIINEGLNILKNTLATKGIYACGQSAKQIGRSKKSSEKSVSGLCPVYAL